MGKPFLRSAVYRRWRLRMTAAWAKKLNRIIVLDAPDSVLVERIGGRSQPHETKGKSPEVGYEFLTRHRRAFDQTIAAMTNAGGPEAHRIDTGSLPPGRVAAAVAAELGLDDHEPSP
jgi:thymidylate kinase